MYKWFRAVIITEFILVLVSLVAMLFVMRSETENSTTITHVTKQYFVKGDTRLYDVQDSIYKVRGNFLPDEYSEVYFLEKEPELTQTLFPSNKVLSVSDDRYVLHFCGHFTEDIAENTRLLLRCDNMSVRIRVNNINVFQYGIDTPKPSYIKTPGNKWVAFVTPEIKTGDIVQIELANSYAYHSTISFNRFFNEIYKATPRFVLTKDTIINIKFLFFSLLIIGMGFIAFFMYIILLLEKQNYKKLGLFSFSTLFTSVWFSLNFHYTSFFVCNPEFNNLLLVSSIVLSFVCISLYFMLDLQKVLRYIILFISEVLLFILLVGIFCQFLGKCDLFNYLPICLQCCYILSCITILFLFYSYIKNRNKDFLYQFITGLIILIGFSFDLFTRRNTNLPLMTYTKMSFAIFTVLQQRFVVRFLKTLVRKTAERKFVEQQAYRDEMTHVGNKLGWERKIKELSQLLTDSKQLGLLVFDVNNLKQINDTYGHEEGDQLIQQACNVICEVFRRSAVYRIGGDEFVAVINGEQCSSQGETSEEALQNEFRQRFHMAIKERNQNSTTKLVLSVACGFALSILGEDTLQSIFDRADMHMYEDKIQGKAKK